MIEAVRLLKQPIICAGMDERMGTNINGPSLIAVPDWVPNPLGKFYLYFAHHRGRYIRMAYADRIEGPWEIYSPGVLDLEDSFFETKDIDKWSEELKGTDLYAHIASPDVHIDHRNKRLRMYYHGMLSNADQQTRVAYSKDGIHFLAKQELLGAPYFRVFKYSGWIYALSWGGQLLRSKGWAGPFEPGPVLAGITTNTRPNRILRHCAIHVKDKHAHVFFSCIGDTPESILHTKINLEQDWKQWAATSISSILKPSFGWEGADLPVSESEIGAVDAPCHQLRDPCVFEYHGVIYLLYCGAGESGGIGVATLAGI